MKKTATNKRPSTPVVDLTFTVVMNTRGMLRDMCLVEAARFEDLAKDASLKMVRTMDKSNNEHGPYSTDAISFRTLATNHILRAETYRHAAALVAGKARQ